MSASLALIIVVPLLIVIALLVTFLTTRSSDASGLGWLSRETKARDAAVGLTVNDDVEVVSGREVEKAAALARIGGDIEPIKAAPAAPVAWSPPDPEALGVTRRQFLNRASIGLTLLGVSGFGAASLAFLWPKAGGGFGSKVKLGSISDVNTVIASGQPANNFSYFAEAQTYLQPFPAEALAAGKAVYDERMWPGLEAGYVALWQKCPHLGCKVPACNTSQWFECPCHGSQYNRVGEKKAGPAARGMDRFPITIEGDDVIVDTGTVIIGPTPGVNTTNQGQEGPNCTSGGH